MTEAERQECWKKIYQHPAYLPYVKWQSTWPAVEIDSMNLIKKANWCCVNIEGFFAIRRDHNLQPIRIFLFNKEKDAVAFKLRWI